MNRAIKGRAHINVSDELIQHAGVKIEKPLAGNVYWDAMEVKELFDTFQGFLLLPAEYTIIGVFFDLPFYQWTIIVESDDLPMPKEGETLPMLYPMYQRTADGKVSVSIDHPYRWTVDMDKPMKAKGDNNGI